MRRTILGLLAILGLTTVAPTASAQYFNPYGYGYGYSIPPSGLTNMPNVYNPWARYRDPYASYFPQAAYYNAVVAYNSATVFNPSLYSPYGFNNYGYQSFGFNQFNALGLNNLHGLGVNNLNAVPQTSVQKEVGGFVPVNRTTAVNPVSGTILKPYKGVALTREGTFYQVPGTGSITAWGTYVPGSGVYVNPLTGTQYNPATGLIVR